MPSAGPRRRVCSGACPFFMERYRDGRKIAGCGTCSRGCAELDVHVGTLCAHAALAQVAQLAS